MKKMYSLAIVIPAYKATFFRETLESIASQTENRFTLYIGDDCSPNELKPIVDDFLNRINIVYHRFEENLGGKDLVAHWERCIALTKDEPYIWLFSDDDVMSPTCVADFYAAVDKDNSKDLYRFNVNVINNKGETLRKVIYPKEISSRNLYLKKINGSLECYVVEYIFKRAIYEKCNGFVRFDLAWGSDLATWVLFGMGKDIMTLESNGIFWRSSGENISTDYNAKTLVRKVAALVDCLKWGEHMFPDNEVKLINRKGLISRLSSIGVNSSYSIGANGVKLYASNAFDCMRLGAKYSLYYLYKKIKNVF